MAKRKYFFFPCHLSFNIYKSLFKQNQPKISTVKTLLSFLWDSIKLACVVPFSVQVCGKSCGFWFLLAGGVGCWMQFLSLVCNSMEFQPLWHPAKLLSGT